MNSAPITCTGVIIAYASGDGLCELGDRCPADDLRWNDYPTYVKAHNTFAIRGEPTDE